MPGRFRGRGSNALQHENCQAKNTAPGSVRWKQKDDYTRVYPVRIRIAALRIASMLGLTSAAEL
jgi:hypothetical protein